VLDAKLPPQDKIEIAPDLFGGPRQLTTPRGELQKIDRPGSHGPRWPGTAGNRNLSQLGDQLDERRHTGAVRSAFRPTFLVTSALAAASRP